MHVSILPPFLCSHFLVILFRFFFLSAATLAPVIQFCLLSPNINRSIESTANTAEDDATATTTTTTTAPPQTTQTVAAEAEASMTKVVENTKLTASVAIITTLATTSSPSPLLPTSSLLVGGGGDSGSLIVGVSSTSASLNATAATASVVKTRVTSVCICDFGCLLVCLVIGPAYGWPDSGGCSFFYIGVGVSFMQAFFLSYENGGSLLFSFCGFVISIGNISHSEGAVDVLGCRSCFAVFFFVLIAIDAAVWRRRSWKHPHVDRHEWLRKKRQIFLHKTTTTRGCIQAGRQHAKTV